MFLTFMLLATSLVMRCLRRWAAVLFQSLVAFYTQSRAQRLNAASVGW